MKHFPAVTRSAKITGDAIRNRGNTMFDRRTKNVTIFKDSMEMMSENERLQQEITDTVSGSRKCGNSRE